MTLLYILLALLVLLVMITVHEFGHYCAGKVLGFKINEFAIGFGPVLYKRKRKDGEKFSIRALPLGGFCAFEGEDEDGNKTEETIIIREGIVRQVSIYSSKIWRGVSRVDGDVCYSVRCVIDADDFYALYANNTEAGN